MRHVAWASAHILGASAHILGAHTGRTDASTWSSTNIPCWRRNAGSDALLCGSHALLCVCSSPHGQLFLSVAVCCSVLQCVAVCCSVLQCVAVCCSVLQCESGDAQTLSMDWLRWSWVLLRHVSAWPINLSNWVMWLWSTLVLLGHVTRWPINLRLVESCRVWISLVASYRVLLRHLHCWGISADAILSYTHILSTPPLHTATHCNALQRTATHEYHPWCHGCQERVGTRWRMLIRAASCAPIGSGFVQ